MIIIVPFAARLVLAAVAACDTLHNGTFVRRV